jgi:hypothetical protein
MRHKLFAPMLVISALALQQQAHAGTLIISAINNAIVPGGGVITGNLTLTWGVATDAKYNSSNPLGTGYQITGITGQISDSSPTINITNEPVKALVGLVPYNPGPSDPAATADLSYLYPVPFTYDNLVWPGGSAVVCTGFNSSGALVDVYGVLFTLNNGDYVDLWGNGRQGATQPGFPYVGPGYGIGIYNPADPPTVYDYVTTGVNLTVPEPSTWAIMGLGFIGLGLTGLRRTRRPTEVAEVAPV